MAANLETSLALTMGNHLGKVLAYDKSDNRVELEIDLPSAKWKPHECQIFKK